MDSCHCEGVAWWHLVSFRNPIRLFLRLTAVCMLGLLCLLMTSRWWLPPVLPRLAGIWSVELTSVERLEGGRLRLSGLALDLDSATVQIDQVELPFEWVYLQERFWGDWSEASAIHVGHVQVFARESISSPAEAKSATTFLPQVLRQVSSGIGAADLWLPQLVAERIEYRNEDQIIATVSSIECQARRITAQGSLVSMPGQWQAAAELSTDAPWQLEFSHDLWKLSGALSVERSPNQVSLKAHAERSDSGLALTATFGELSWLPTKATVSSAGFDLSGIQLLNDKLPLAALRLEQFQAEWDGENYRFQIKGESVVAANDQPEQAVAFDCSGDGDLKVLHLQAATLTSEWANLKLSEPLTVDFARRNFLGEARLRAEVDLAQQPWIAASGRVEAELILEADSPDALRFDLNGRDLVYEDVAIHSLEAEGRVGFDQLSIESLKVIPAEAVADEGVELSGTVDFQAKELGLTYSALLGAGWVNRLIGKAVLVGPLELQAGRISGPWGAPELSGQLRTTLETEATEAIELSAEVGWDGRQRLTWAGTASCNGAEIEAVASAILEEDTYSLRVESFLWSDPDRPELILESPVQMSWQRSGELFEKRLSVSAFTLRGDDMKASAAYAPVEGLELLLKNVSLVRIDRWVKQDLPIYHVESVAFKLTKFRPFLAGRVEIALEEQVEAAVLARLELSADLKEHAIDVKDLTLRFAEEEVLQGSLGLPLRLQLPFLQYEAPALKQRFYALGGGGLRGRLEGRSSPGFINWLESRTGLRIGETVVDVELAGDLSQPVGHVHLQVAELGFGPDLSETSLPAIRALDLQLEVDEQAVDVQTLNFLLNQSAVRASVTIPMKALVDAAKAVAFEPEQLLRSASGKVQLEDWQMENWLDQVPPFFRRSGSLSGSFEVLPPLQLSGELRFEDFGLRPTTTLASVDQIAGRLQLNDRLVRIVEAGARVGGSRVELIGEVNLADWKQPQWFIDVSGQNVPLFRTTEMILRSDLDIHVEARNPALTPLVAGSMNLRSSTLLVEFDPLAPRLKKGTAARPPFFRIAEEPVAEWRFDLQATGDRFMRVRSPYFKTQLSAAMKLTGTFAEPQMLGSVRTHDAQLSFPGAKFVINEGEALIEASRPNEVQLAFNGIAQKASKVIVMDVSQTLEDPLIHFESTPPMSQGDIVRLLATGSTTGGGVGNLGIYLGQGLLGAGGMNESFADKLTVDVGEETSRSGRKTLGARYELTPRWSVEGEYDVFDAYNTDLIWTIFKR